MQPSPRRRQQVFASRRLGKWLHLNPSAGGGNNAESSLTSRRKPKPADSPLSTTIILTNLHSPDSTSHPPSLQSSPCYCPTRSSSARRPSWCDSVRPILSLSARSRSAELAGVASPNHRAANESGEVASDDPLDTGRGNVHHYTEHGNANQSPLNKTVVGLETPQRHNAVHPVVRARSEYSTLYRKDPSGKNGKQNVVCVLSIEVPPRRPLTDEDAKLSLLWRNLDTVTSRDQGEDSGPQRSFSPQPVMHRDFAHHRSQQSIDGSVDGTTDAGDGYKESESGQRTDYNNDEGGFSYGATPAAGNGNGNTGKEEPHAAILQDLRERVNDWKGQTMERFGDFILYDYLGVRQDAVLRNFWVYCES